MSKFRPDDDRKIVAFLQQYRPIPPPVKASSEQELMAIIDRQERTKKTWKIKPLIAIASATFAGTILAWLGSYRFLTPTYTNAQLETFLLDSWDGSLGETSSQSFDYWLNLSDRETKADSENTNINEVNK